MKKLITFLIGFLMILSVLAQPPVPAPVKLMVTVNGENIDYPDTKVTNKRTGEVLTSSEVGSLEITNGIGMVDLSKFKQGYIPASAVYDGDIIEIVACNIHADCTYDYRIENTNPKELTISVISGDVYICWDGSTVTNPANCPEQPTEPQEYICWDGSVVIDLNDCPVEEEVESKVTADEEKESATVTAFYGQEINILLDNNKISKLIDDEIYFNGENYEVKEEIYFNGIAKTSIDDEDFGLNPYLIIDEIGVEYSYIFKEVIDLAEITEEEPLEIVFSGKELKIIKASANEITIRSGEEYFLKEGESITIEGKKVIVKLIGEDSVLVSVDGTEQIINEGNDREVNGLKILVDEILYRDADSSAELIIGTETDETIKDGDYFELFEKDSEEYEWIIQLDNEQYLGYWNVEEYSSVDEDDDYHPLGIGEVLSLPNNYLDIKFKGVSESDLTSMKFKIKDNYLYVKSDDDAFSYGTSEYDKLYINSEGIYDKDKEFITDDKVKIGDSDVYLEMGSEVYSTWGVYLKDLFVELDMSDILYNGVSYKEQDNDFMDYSGIIFKNPENSVDEKDGFEVIVPDEQPEVTILFGKETIEEVIEVVEKEVIKEIEVEKETIKEVPIEKEVIVEKETIKEIPINETAKDPVSWLLGALLGLLATILGLFKWGKGFSGILKYWSKKDPERAYKMAKTIIKNYKEGKYK